MRTLIIGRLEGYMTMAAKILMDKGIKIFHVDHDLAALELLRTGQGTDLILMDICENIPQFIGRLQEERIAAPVVACGVGSVNRVKVVEALHAGAKEYLPLPPEPALIAAILEAASHQENTTLFQDAKTASVFALADQIAKSEASVLITGESGTGKEVVAQYIHRKSRRKEKSFISVNCAAIPENLLESELFGHEKGSFTGAIARRIGKFEEAHGGTLLLDEISEMHPRLQAKLLRAIQEREIDRVGGSHPVKVDIRLLATSNRNLLKAVEEGTFREDLYFRLNVVNIQLPPLRERVNDIPILASHFIVKYAEVNGVSQKSLSAATFEALKKYTWPGNVRELENTMHRAVLLCPEDEVSPEHLFLNNDLRNHSSSGSENRKNASSSTEWTGQTIFDAEKNLIFKTLDHCLGNKTHSAHILGISIRTLRNKLKQYDIENLFEENNTSQPPPKVVVFK